MAWDGDFGESEQTAKLKPADNYKDQPNQVKCQRHLFRGEKGGSIRMKCVETGLWQAT